MFEKPNEYLGEVKLEKISCNSLAVLYPNDGLEYAKTLIFSITNEKNAEGWKDHRFTISLKSIGGEFVDRISKDPSKPFIEQFKYLIRTAKCDHYIHIKNNRIEDILTQFYCEDDMEKDYAYPSYNLTWHPDFIEMMPEEDKVYVGDYRGDYDHEPLYSTKIIINGYKKLKESKGYMFDGEIENEWAWERCNAIVCKSLYSDNLEGCDYEEVYDPSLLILKEEKDMSFVPNGMKLVDP